MNEGHSQVPEPETWLGRTQVAEDEITAFPLRALAATLDRDDPPAVKGTPVPPLWHWLYFLPLYRPYLMRRDGHVEGGDFMPPIALPRRVWAASKFAWNVDNLLRVGNKVKRVSRIDSITPKEGRGGKLVFVKVIHEFHNESGLSLTNEHQSAFREAPKPGHESPAHDAAKSDGAWHRTLVPDPTLLFRYSALTFNSHRIHYDSPYTTQEEGYPSLLVQGPLIGTLLMDLLRKNAPESSVRNFELKALRPTFVDQRLHLRGAREGKSVRLWAANDNGSVAMTASAEVA